MNYRAIVLSALFIGAMMTFAPSSLAATKRTQTLWVSSIKQGVTVIPYIRPDKKVLFVDFEDFNGVEYIYYNLKYFDKNNGILNGIEGSFLPIKEFYTGYIGKKPFIRKEFILGTCSRGACIYHKAKDVVLTVNTKLKNGKHYSNEIKFPNDQF